MKALITGGAGFIGSHLTDSLLADGAEVIVLDDFSTGRRENLAHVSPSAPLDVVEGSVLDESLTRELVREADQVYHLAAAVGVHRILDRPLASIEVNLRGTENVLKYAVEGQPVMIASTSEVYGKNTSDALTEEDDSIIGATCRSRWLYATSKAMDEFLGQAHHRERGVQTVMVRYFNTVGPRQTGMYGMVLPNFVRSALAAEPIRIFGSGQQRRNFTYVGDAVRGTRLLMETQQAAGQVFNMGASEEVSIEQLALRVRRIAGSKSPLQYVPYSQAYGDGFEDMQRRVPSTEKLRQAIGYAPDTTLDETIRSVVEYYRQGALTTA
ncbi:MAG: NAD-dependent epimerase/dehydratase family protein [Armatimonadetes bacterium]|nr:NAD-dependent epimerase/dehydratase family protein [Armatimonadota bacterium]